MSLSKEQVPQERGASARCGRLGRRVRALGALALAFPLLHAVASPALRAQAEPRLNEVRLPLREYLALVESADRAEQERKRSAANRVDPLAEVASQSTRITLGDGIAAVRADFEVLVQGHPKFSVPLPANLVARASSIERAGGGAAPSRTALNGASGQVSLVAPEAGRYAVRLEGEARLERLGGVSRYTLAPVAAPVAVAEVDFAAELEWSVLGAVVVDEKVEGGRRKIRLSARRGSGPAVEVHRRLEGGDAEKLLAQATVLTLFQLGPEGAQRHDVVLYEVSRGSLASFTVEVPEGLEVEKAGTDEGEVVPVADARRITLHRRSQLQRGGYLVLTSTPAAGAGLTLAPVLPGVEVRARYLAVASTVAAEAEPQPATSWSRVDLQDLPAPFRDALSALDPTAAWRSALPEGAGGPVSRLAVARALAAPLVPTVIRSRETTTVVTVDGTVLHRDRIALLPLAGVAAALDVTLPAGSTLWSVKVDEQPVRPLEKGGVVTIPLGFADLGGPNGGKGPVVEVVSVLEKAMARGRSSLDLELPRLASPVQDHRWRLLLPSGATYRFERGDLRPEPAARVAPPPRRSSGWRKAKAPVPAEPEGVPGGVAGGAASEAGESSLDARRIATGATATEAELDRIPKARDPWAILQKTPGVLTDRINVGGNESGQQSRYAAASQEMKQEVASLKSGTVGGVRSLPVTIPESGKILVMTGILPPERVAVSLSVKGKG